MSLAIPDQAQRKRPVRPALKVCLISNQIAAWGKIGGFGTATRALGRGLAAQGVEVHAVVVRRASEGQRRLEQLDGIVVHGMSRPETVVSGRVFRRIGADIYHSQEPTIASRLAQRSMPDRVHVVTCRDPRGWREHFTELRHASLKRRLMAPLTWYYEASPWVKSAVRHSDVVLTPAPRVLDARIHNLYGDQIRPEFVPYPIDFPAGPPRKAERPLILFVGRFDRRKRIEVFFDLARSFPEAEFVAVGRAHEESYDRYLRRKYGGIANLELPGFVSRFDPPGLLEYYERAWVLVNTSAREGLPYTFLEAAGFGVSILSSLDPDGFASRFGYFVKNGDFAQGLHHLLQDQNWRAMGAKGIEYVRATWNEQNCIARHLAVYERLLSKQRASR
ncbi:MAG: glycosyltransferase family 4 protein [Acidobacteriota bacterium]|nr:glycosyltransferase family 4 protein [Acidobacteriota bacterium]